MAVFVLSWLAVALAYSGYSDWLSSPVLGHLGVEPAALAVATIVSPLRPLVFTVPDTGGARFEVTGVDSVPAVVSDDRR